MSQASGKASGLKVSRRRAPSKPPLPTMLA
jgi:hypothetical protein